MLQAGGQHWNNNHSSEGYWLAIACGLCKSFTSMLMQIILEHSSGCKVKYAIECMEQKGNEEKKSHKMSKATEQEKAS